MSKPNSAVAELLDAVLEDRAECIPVATNDRDSDGFRPFSEALNDVLRGVIERHNKEAQMPASLPLPVKLLLSESWEAAAKQVLAAVQRHIEGLLKGELRLALSPKTFMSDTARRTVLDVAARRCYDHGHTNAGIALHMLAADLRSRLSFARFLPQLEWLCEQTDKQESNAWPRHDLDRALRNLKVWRRCATDDAELDDGSFTVFEVAYEQEMESTIRAQVDLHDALAAINDEPESDPRPSSTPLFRKPPGVTVLPSAPSLATHQYRGTFDPIVGKHVLHVLASDVAGVRRTLTAEYPHAVQAIDLLTRGLRDGEPVCVSPVLLTGPAGTGKSRLARRLAELLGLSVYRYDGAQASDSMFGGSPKAWSNSTPSVPVRAVAQAQRTNPLVFVDEIEKAGTSHHNGNLWSSMMPFLERETAKRYRDVSLDAEIDLSWVSYVATANDDQPLPGPLKDRFRIVRVPSPTLAHLPALAANVIAEVERDDGSAGFNDPLADDELAVIGQAWSRSRFSLRTLQRIVRATMEARAQFAPRH